MGLDITAYSKAVRVTNHEPFEDDWCDNYQHVQAYLPHPEFARSFRGLENRVCYDIVGAEVHGFRAGSYGGYNAWRDDLSRFALGVEAKKVWADPASYVNSPFYELINFADNEGSIGPEAAVDLLKDFYDHRARYEAEHRHEPYDIESYMDWLRAFELAAAGGLVDFH